MLNKFSKIILFYFAYLPLFIILIINNITDLKNMFITLGIAIFLGFLFIWLFFRTIKNVIPSRERVSINELKNSEYLGFLVTYIIPFFITLTNVRQFISFCFLILIVAYLYLDTTLFCINPLLKIFFRYNIYEVYLGKEKYFLLSKKKYKKENLQIEIKKLDNKILIEN